MAGERILVVDDEEHVQRLLSEVCRRAGYDVVTVGDGAEAIKALEERFFPVCVVDLHLPQVDGMEVLRRARQLYPETQVIIFTGYGDLQTAVEALRLGAYDYLEKPFADIDLIRVGISRAIERWRLAASNTRLLEDLQEANQELELRRRQQLQYINYIGQAMGGALRTKDASQVLLGAIIHSTGCDAGGVLLLPPHDTGRAWALTDGRNGFSSQAQRALVQAMVDYLPERARPDIATVEMHDLREGRGEEQEVEDWRHFEFGLLQVRDQLYGVAAVVNHSEEPLSSEALSFFSILTAQGSTAVANAYLFARTRELATRDGLTGLYNRRHFFELIEAETGRAERHDEELAIIMLDIDKKGKGMGLKAVNDTYGHQAGDDLLRAIGQLIKGIVRKADVVARYGGDEFIIMAPETSRKQAIRLARRVCKSLYDTPFRVADTEVHVTASFGAAVFSPGIGQSIDDVVSLADQGLYLAKDRGGHLVCFVDLSGHDCREP